MAGEHDLVVPDRIGDVDGHGRVGVQQCVQNQVRIGHAVDLVGAVRRAPVRIGEQRVDILPRGGLIAEL